MVRGRRRFVMDFSSEILAQLENCRPFIPQGTEPVTSTKYHPLRRAEAQATARPVPRMKMSKAIGAALGIKE